MAKKFVLALDQGTSSSRALLFDKEARLVSIDQIEIASHFPKNGWVEQDPVEILNSQMVAARNCLVKANVSASEIECIGLTNQRETTIAWNRDSGEPVYNAIVWQDRRGEDLCNKLRSGGEEDHIRSKTGLLLDPYFSSTKMHWILENVSEAKKLNDTGNLCFGTVDTWLLWNFSNKKSFLTDPSNASRTMLYNIHQEKWDEELLGLFGIHETSLPEVKNSADEFIECDFLGEKIKITAVLGDQQAALYGQLCDEPGMAKNTYGTGCFLLMNTGGKALDSKKGMLTTIAWKENGQTSYAIEGSVFNGGSAIAWLRDEMNIIERSSESEQIALRAKEDHGLVMVPAFTGLGAPYWNSSARGALFGLKRDSGKPELVRATLESIAFQCLDICSTMEEETGIALKKLAVDGGASENDFLMQFQADMLNIDVVRPQNPETTALGAAFMAGVFSGFFSKEKLITLVNNDRIFNPCMDEGRREALYSKWKEAVKRCGPLTNEQ